MKLAASKVFFLEGDDVGTIFVVTVIGAIMKLKNKN